jgi:hypothetical protein
MNLLFYPLGVPLDRSLVVLKQLPRNLTWWKYKVTGTMTVMSDVIKLPIGIL